MSKIVQRMVLAGMLAMGAASTGFAQTAASTGEETVHTEQYTRSVSPEKEFQQIRGQMNDAATHLTPAQRADLAELKGNVQAHFSGPEADFQWTIATREWANNQTKAHGQDANLKTFDDAAGHYLIAEQQRPGHSSMAPEPRFQATRQLVNDAVAGLTSPQRDALGRLKADVSARYQGTEADNHWAASSLRWAEEQAQANPDDKGLQTLAAAIRSYSIAQADRNTHQSVDPFWDKLATHSTTSVDPFWDKLAGH